MDESINPFFLPVMLIILEAAIIKMAVPTIDNDIGNVDKDLIGLMLDPIIPLKKTVTGATENAHALLANSNQTFLFIRELNSFLTLNDSVQSVSYTHLTLPTMYTV